MQTVTVSKKTGAVIRLKEPVVELPTLTFLRDNAGGLFDQLFPTTEVFIKHVESLCQLPVQGLYDFLTALVHEVLERNDVTYEEKDELEELDLELFAKAVHNDFSSFI